MHPATSLFVSATVNAAICADADRRVGKAVREMTEDEGRLCAKLSSGAGMSSLLVRRRGCVAWPWSTRWTSRGWTGTEVPERLGCKRVGP